MNSPAMLYEADYWAMKKSQTNKVGEMGMLRWMSALILKDIIRNDKGQHKKNASIKVVWPCK